MIAMIHNTFTNPEVSWRRNRSPKIVNRIQSQITKPKKISIVQKTSKNG